MDPGLSFSACPDCNISAAAAGNIDEEVNRFDTWYLSTDDAEFTMGTCGTHRSSAKAGHPFNVYDDRECD